MSDYHVTMKFDRKDDAIAIMELLRDLGVESSLTLKKRTVNIPMSQTRAGILAMEYFDMHPNRHIHYTEIGRWLVQNHYKDTSASPVCSGLTREGLLKAYRGYYRRRT
jgi:hypothetical protein